MMNKKLLNRFDDFHKLVQFGQKLDGYSWFRAIESEQGTEIVIKGRKVLMFGSNSYLGLTTHPKIKRASQAAIEKYGTSSSGSRFLNGSTDLHEELEYRLAKFLNKEAVILFGTGFQVNTGVIPSITTENDIVISDRLNHASIIEGARLSSAKSVMYKHNNMASLEQKLRLSTDAETRLIVVDGIFSMEGDIAKLPEITQLAQKYNAVVMCDCAHAIGVIGENGSGTASHFGIIDQVDLIGGTLSKSLASLGGFVASDVKTINYIKHHARSLIFSASPTPASVAAALAALDLIESDSSLIDEVNKKSKYAIKKLNAMGFDTGKAETPIIPIYIRNEETTYRLTSLLLKKGVFVNAVVAPAVAPQDSLIRFSVMATHTIEQIDQAIELIVECANKLGMSLVSEQRLLNV